MRLGSQGKIMARTLRRSSALVFLSLALPSLAAAQSAPTQDRTQLDPKLQALLEPGLWGIADNTAAMQAMLFSDQLGTFVVGPETISLTERSELPLVVARLVSFKTEHQMPFHARGVLVSTDLRTGEVRGAKAFPPGRGRTTGPPVSVDQDPAGLPKGNTGTVYRIDARHVLELPWEPGDFAFQFIIGSEASNQVRVRLGEPDPVSLQPVGVASIFPPEGPGALPDYRRRSSSLPIPTEPGIVLSTDAGQATEQGVVLLRGAFRLDPGVPVAMPFVGDGGVEGENQGSEPEARSPRALVPLTLLLHGRVQGDRYVWHLRLPCYEESDVGQWAIDLRQLQGFPEGTREAYDLFAFSGGLTGSITPTP